MVRGRGENSEKGSYPEMKGAREQEMYGETIAKKEKRTKGVRDEREK